MRLLQHNVVRVAVTGRSLYAVRKVIAPKYPLDYVVFSSGAGVMCWRTQKLLEEHNIGPSSSGYF